MLYLNFATALLLILSFHHAQAWGWKFGSKGKGLAPANPGAVAGLELLPSADFTPTELALLLNILEQIEQSLPPLGMAGPPPPPSLGGAAGPATSEMPLLSPRDLTAPLEDVQIKKSRLETLILGHRYAFTVRRLGPKFSIEVKRDDAFTAKFDSTKTSLKWKCFVWHQGQWENANPQYWDKGHVPDLTRITMAQAAHQLQPESLPHRETRPAGDFKRQLAFQSLAVTMELFFAESLTIQSPEKFLRRWAAISSELRGNKIAKEFAMEMERVGPGSSRDLSMGIGAALDQILRPLDLHLMASELRKFLSTDLNSFDEKNLVNYGNTVIKQMEFLDVLGFSEPIKEKVLKKAQIVRRILLDTQTDQPVRSTSALKFLSYILNELQLDRFFINVTQLTRVQVEIEALRSDLLSPWEAIKRRAEADGLFQRRTSTDFGEKGGEGTVAPPRKTS